MAKKLKELDVTEVKETKKTSKKTEKPASKEKAETKSSTKTGSKKKTGKNVEEITEEKPKKRASKKKADAVEEAVAKEVVGEITDKKTKAPKKPSKKATKVVKEETEDKDFFYGDDDEEEKPLSEDFDDEDQEDYDEITEEELELSQDLDLEDFENFVNEEEDEDGSSAGRRVFKVSAQSEETRKRFISICEKYNSGDPDLKSEAIGEAVEELRSFVHYVIKKKYSTYGKHYEDLVQEGIMGIIKGLEKYNPQKSLPTTFFNLYIIHEMSKYVDTEVNKTTSHYSSNLTKINRVIDKFDQQGRKWNATDIAVETGLNMETVIQCLHIKDYKNEMYYESDEILESQIKEHDDSPEQTYVKNERLDVLYRSIGTLLPEEIQVLKYRYGLQGAQTISYKDIAKEMGVSIEKVRKYRHDAIKKLRHKSAMRSVFKDYINESDNDSYTEGEIPVVQTSMIDHAMHELEEIEFDFDSLNDGE